jgi:hypothetical protein
MTRATPETRRDAQRVARHEMFLLSALALYSKDVYNAWHTG